MGVDAGLYVYDVVVKKFTFTIVSPDEFLFSSQETEKNVSKVIYFVSSGT